MADTKIKKKRIPWNKGKKSSKEAIEKNRLARLKIVDRNKGMYFEEIDNDWAKLIGYLLSDGYWVNIKH